MRSMERKGAPIIVSWIGRADIEIMNAWRRKHQLRQATGVLAGDLPGVERPGENGPIRAFTDGREAEIVWLLTGREFEGAAEMVAEWVRRGTRAECRVFRTGLKDPASHAEACQAAERFFQAHWNAGDAGRHIFHVTSGTPAIQAAMFHLIQARHPGGEIWRVEGNRCVREDPPFRVPAGALGDGPAGRAVPDGAFQDILEIYAPVRSVNILIQGEAGTGRRLHALKIHEACGVHGPFVDVGYAEIAAGDGALFRPALFGQGSGRGGYAGADRKVRGAFERAEGGTLFLDDVDGIPLHLQGVLLRCLRDGRFVPEGAETPVPVGNVRIVSGAGRNLLEEVRAGRFREDLHYLLAMCACTLAPLREIAAGDGGRFLEIAAGILEDAAKRDAALDRPWRLSGEALRILRAHSWPGNMRELEHVLLLACVRAGHGGRTELRAADVSPHILRRTAPAAGAVAERSSREEGGDWLPEEGLEEWLRRRKRELIDRALRLAGGSKAGASRLLGEPKHYLNNAFKSARLGMAKR